VALEVEIPHVANRQIIINHQKGKGKKKTLSKERKGSKRIDILLGKTLLFFSVKLF
jgi:hypothetical protein